MTRAPPPAGFTLSDQVQQTIALRYASSTLSVDFDGFVACVTRLETLFSESLSPWTLSHFSRGAGRGRRQNGQPSVTAAPLGEGRQRLELATLGQRLPFFWRLKKVPSELLCTYYVQSLGHGE